MIHVTYQDLVMRFGEPAAHGLMQTLERHARLSDSIVTPLERDERFRRALDALGQINFAT